MADLGRFKLRSANAGFDLCIKDNPAEYQRIIFTSILYH